MIARRCGRQFFQAQRHCLEVARQLCQPIWIGLLQKSAIDHPVELALNVGNRFLPVGLLHGCEFRPDLVGRGKNLADQRGNRKQRRAKARPPLLAATLECGLIADPPGDFEKRPVDCEGQQFVQQIRRTCRSVVRDFRHLGVMQPHLLKVRNVLAQIPHRPGLAQQQQSANSLAMFTLRRLQAVEHTQLHMVSIVDQCREAFDLHLSRAPSDLCRQGPAGPIDESVALFHTSDHPLRRQRPRPAGKLLL